MEDQTKQILKHYDTKLKKIFEELFHTTHSGKLYHYTKSQNLKPILESGTLLISKANELDDKWEIKLGKEVIEGCINEYVQGSSNEAIKEFFRDASKKFNHYFGLGLLSCQDSQADKSTHMKPLLHNIVADGYNYAEVNLYLLSTCRSKDNQHLIDNYGDTCLVLNQEYKESYIANDESFNIGLLDVMYDEEEFKEAIKQFLETASEAILASPDLVRDLDFQIILLSYLITLSAALKKQKYMEEQETRIYAIELKIFHSNGRESFFPRDLSKHKIQNDKSPNGKECVKLPFKL